MQYHYRKNKTGLPKKDVHVPRLCKNNTGGTYHMLNLRTKLIILICDVIQLNKTYREYVSRKENTKADSYILKYVDDSYNWAHVKNYPVNNEVNNEKEKKRIKH